MAAKNTIVTRISLEGAQQITGDLKNLGDAGEKALKQIKSAADAAGSGGAKLAAVIGGARAAFSQFGTAASNFGRAIEGVGRSLETVRNRIGLVTAAIGVASGAFLALNISAGKSAEELQNNASAVGLTAGEYQKFRFAAEQVGLSSDQFTQAMSVLTDQMQQTKDAVDPTTTALGKLGISVTDGFGGLRPAADVLQEFMTRIAGMADGTEKTSLVIDIFGRRIGARLIPFLNLGAEGLHQLGDEAVRLGAVVSDETLGKLAAFDDSIDKLKSTANGARLSLAAIFAPALTAGANALSELIAANESKLQEFAQFLLETIEPVIRDVFLALTGQDSQVQIQWILDAKQQLIELGQAAQAAFVDIIVPALEAVNAVAATVATAINNIFGTEFTGKELLIAAAVLSLSGIFGAFVSVIGAVVAALGVLSTTVGLVVAAVVLVGADIVLFAKLMSQIDWAGIGQAIYSAIAGAFEAMGTAISGFVSGALAKARALFDDFVTYIEGTWLGAILSAVGRALDAIAGAKSASENLSNAPAGAGGLAKGGRPAHAGRRGPRDNLLAWFDAREFVIRPQATAKLGSNVLNFINQTGELPGFAMGGMVAAAGGGSAGIILAPVSKSAAAGEGRHNTLNLTIDGESFPGLGMDDQTLTALSSFVSKKKMVSGGVKPSFYK